MGIVLERKITYSGGKKIHPWIHLGHSPYLESLGIKFSARVYCMRYENGSIVLVPAPSQKPRANRCYRAIIYNINGVYRLRMSYLFLKQVGMPKQVSISFESDKIILRPIK